MADAVECIVLDDHPVGWLEGFLFARESDGDGCGVLDGFLEFLEFFCEFLVACGVFLDGFLQCSDLQSEGIGVLAGSLLFVQALLFLLEGGLQGGVLLLEGMELFLCVGELLELLELFVGELR